jgi:hypothetical protein
VADDSPLPESPEAAGQPARGRSLVGFYIAIGVVAALVLLGAWLQAPLRIWYWEGAVRRACAASERLSPYDSRGTLPIRQAARGLAMVGPQARPALDRVLRDPELSNSEWILWGIQDADAAWALPLVVREAEAQEYYDDIAATALVVAGSLARQEFVNSKAVYDLMHTDSGKNLYKVIGPGRARLLDWWEREGKAKYGEPKR